MTAPPAPHSQQPLLNSRINVVHTATFIDSLGGLQSILRQHVERDPLTGLDSSFIVLFEKPSGRDPDRVKKLGLTWRHSFRDARRRFRSAVQIVKFQIAVYHDIWGMSTLCDLDGSPRRIGLIHCPSAFVMKELSNSTHLLDGILTVGEPSMIQCRRFLTGFPEERLGVLPVPVADPEISPVHPPLSGRPIIIGYSGRLVRSLKRIDRLVSICEILEQQQQPFRLEILGEGKDGSWLRKHLHGNPRVIFHGYQTGKAYWEILGTWDVILYTSDTEGFGISLLEAMKLGVIPLYPDIGGGAENHVKEVRRSLLYPAGDMYSVAQLLAGLRGAPVGETDQLRQACRLVAGRNDTAGYHAAFAGFARKVLDMPRLSFTPSSRQKLSITRFAPFGLLSRLPKSAM